MNIETVKIPFLRGKRGRFRKIGTRDKLEYAYQLLLQRIVWMFLGAAALLLLLTLLILIFNATKP